MSSILITAVQLQLLDAIIVALARRTSIECCPAMSSTELSLTKPVTGACSLPPFFELLLTGSYNSASEVAWRSALLIVAYPMCRV